jgi:hypothetical protein
MWIDAICINQLDPEERTSQVNQMREIYSQAIMTVIWLCDGNLASKIGFEFLRATPILAEPVENPRGLFSACNNRRREHTQYATILCGILSDRKMGTFFLCALFTGILFRPWWARVWTLREVAVSKKLIMKCGNDEFSWGRFVEIVSMLVLGSDPSASPSPGMRWLESFLSGVEGPLQKVIELSMMRDMYRSGQRVRLPELVAWVKERNATDARDKISALCGLSDSFEDSLLQPDYSMTIKPVDTSCHLAEYAIIKYGTLDLICMSQFDVDRGWPSWIPKWESYSKAEPNSETIISYTRHRYNGLLESFMGVQFQDYARLDLENSRPFFAFLASSDENVKYKLLQEPYILEVMGTCVDIVVHLSKEKSYEERRKQALSTANHSRGCDEAEIDLHIILARTSAEPRSADLDITGGRIIYLVD